LRVHDFDRLVVVERIVSVMLGYGRYVENGEAVGMEM
jgi:hypothetical protein